jgi:hypothetical protein
MNLNIKLVYNVFKKYTDIYESVLLKLFKEKNKILINTWIYFLVENYSYYD